MKEERILIVEDERIIAIDLKGRLQRFGYPEPVITTNGIDALKEIEREEPDIILMDIMLSSDFDGIETANIINKKYNIPIIFITAYSDDNTLERAKLANPVAFVLKPFKERELFTTIEMSIFKFKSDQQIKKQERWSAAILNSIVDGIIAAKEDGTIDFLNPKAEKILGIKTEDVKNLPLNTVFVPLDADTGESIGLPTFTTGDTGSFTYQNTIIATKKGRNIHIEGTVSPIIDRLGKIEGSVVAFRDITRIQKLSEAVSYQDTHDSLTGLTNRKGFVLRLTELLKNRKEHISHAFLYVDLDQFKVINDMYGHDSGDEMLLKATETIHGVVRNSDTCARLGSDEFGILLEGAQLQQALFIGKRLKSRLGESKIIRGKEVFNISASMGLVMIDEFTLDIQKILAAADESCNIAKEEGGKQIVVYNDKENLFVKRRDEMQWIPRLKKALKENQFELFLQPIVSLDENEGNKKGEILIRLKDANGKYTPPSDFLPSAERYNLMPAVDRWVIAEAFNKHKHISDIMGKERNPYIFSINLSPDFLADDSSLDYIFFKMEEFEITPKSICFEITETAAISNIQAATDFINELKNKGCSFSLDDFGSGFSSFNYLKNLPIDYLKIDGVFVKDMDTDSVNRAMVQAMNNLGQIIGLKTIAEFVRNSEIIEHLKEIGVNYLQGYETGKPEPLINVIEKLLQEK